MAEQRIRIPGRPSPRHSPQHREVPPRMIQRRSAGNPRNGPQQVGPNQWQPMHQHQPPYAVGQAYWGPVPPPPFPPPPPPMPMPFVPAQPWQNRTQDGYQEQQNWNLVYHYQYWSFVFCNPTNVNMQQQHVPPMFY